MKPVIIGMNNPLSQRAGFELYPHPPGCTGYRLWKMLFARTGVSRKEYLEAFERRNLVTGVAWNAAAGRDSAARMRDGLRGRVVLLLGRAVQQCFDVPPLLVHPQYIDGVTWRQLPHPSGRNLWYNDMDNIRVAELLMEDLYDISKQREVA